jgi:MarR family transcriptional regulator, negative regulator of the multidrug operon emrRAB
MLGAFKLAAVTRSTPSMATALPDLPMPETVMVRHVRILASSMTRYFEPVFQRAGLTENIFHVLCLLIAADDGQASPGELSELIGTSKANTTRILDQLIPAGLVSRTVDATDSRRHVIQITPHGRTLASETVPKMMEALRQAFSGLTLDEFVTLGALIQKAIVSLDNGSTSAGAQ